MLLVFNTSVIGVKEQIDLEICEVREGLLHYTFIFIGVQ